MIKWFIGIVGVKLIQNVYSKNSHKKIIKINSFN